MDVVPLSVFFEDEPVNSAFCYCKECQIHTGSDNCFGLWIPEKENGVKGITWDATL